MSLVQVARDCEGRVYYYHTHARVAQWEPPTGDQREEEEEEEHRGTEYTRYRVGGSG